MANNKNSHQNANKQNTNKRGYQNTQRKDDEIEKLRKRIFQLEQKQTNENKKEEETIEKEEINENNLIKSRKERLKSAKIGKKENSISNIAKNIIMIAGAMVVIEFFVILKYKMMFWMFF